MAVLTLLEWLAAGLVVGMVILNARLQRAAWVLNAASALAYLVIFASVQLWAQTGLQLVFAGLAAWGWLCWRPLGSAEEPLKPMDWHRPRVWCLSAATVAALTVGLWLLLSAVARSTPQEASAAPAADAAGGVFMLWGDAFTTAGSLVATWMLARRWPENWPLWMVVNSVAAVLFYQQHLLPTAALYGLLTGLAAWGWRQWHQHRLGSAEASIRTTAA